ncbi:MAG: hypothetical protein R3Y53_03895 [Bacillota bacterium]
MKIQYKLSKVFKVIDIFSGKVLDNVNVTSDKATFLVKGNGFYIAQNLENGVYETTFSLHGYEDKTLAFQIEESTEAVVEQLISLIPAKKELIYKQEGQLKNHKNKVLYYTLCCQEYKKRITLDGEEGTNILRLQMPEREESALEGRYFAIENGKNVHTLGKYNFVKNAHTVKETLKESIPVGKFAYLLFETATNEKGEFTLLLPKHLMSEGENSIFIYVDGKTKLIPLTKKEISDGEKLQIKM